LDIRGNSRIFAGEESYKTRKDMATIVLQVEDESLVAKVKQACKMLMGVTSVKVQKTSQRVDDITKTADYKAAMDDVKHGRVTEYDSVEDLFEKLGVAL
jgi:ribosomal protein L23